MRVADRTGSGRQALPGQALGVVRGCPQPAVAVALHGVWRKAGRVRVLKTGRNGRNSRNENRKAKQGAAFEGY